MKNKKLQLKGTSIFLGKKESINSCCCCCCCLCQNTKTILYFKIAIFQENTERSDPTGTVFPNTMFLRTGKQK